MLLWPRVGLALGASIFFLFSDMIIRWVVGLVLGIGR